MKRQVLACAAALCAALLSPVLPPAAAEPTQITMVSNWPDEPAKKAWVSDRVADFNAGNQQCSVKLTFTPKAEIFTQLKATLRTGHAPDIFYMEPDSPEFFDGGYLGDSIRGKSLSPSDASHNGAYLGLGLKF